jgi:phosphosulfolactate synthase
VGSEQSGACNRPGSTAIELRTRPGKPRRSGLTHVIDRGMSLTEIDGMLEVAEQYIDFVKLGWGTALVSANLKAKLGLYAQHSIPVMLGGTLTELAIRQDRLDPYVQWLRELGLDHIEVSDGTLALEQQRKCEIIARLAQEQELTVLSEVGSKDALTIMAPYRWVEQIQAELAAGASRVITEARESGTAGIFRANGEVRTGLVDEIVHAVDPELLIFEAPRKEQQVWFLMQLGPECNFGNIAPSDVIALETLRLGLRSETLEQFALGQQ